MATLRVEHPEDKDLDREDSNLGSEFPQVKECSE